MMENNDLTLTNVWDVRKFDSQKKILVEGLIVVYYGNQYNWLNNPSNGVVRKSEDNSFYIEWEDCATNTPIDNSEKSKTILQYCGWGG